MLVQGEARKGELVCVGVFQHFEEFQILGKAERIREYPCVYHILHWCVRLCSFQWAVREGLAKKATVNRDPKESRESNAGFWGKAYPAEGTGEEKVLKQEHSGVLKESKESCGVEQEKRSGWEEE